MKIYLRVGPDDFPLYFLLGTDEVSFSRSFLARTPSCISLSKLIRIAGGPNLAQVRERQTQSKRLACAAIICRPREYYVGKSAKLEKKPSAKAYCELHVWSYAISQLIVAMPISTLLH